MEVKDNLKYTKTHEWVGEQGGKLRVGITDYAQSELGDVVFVELPEVGAEVEAGSAAMTVESVKAVSEIYAPLGGKIVAINEELGQKPELINESPYETGWLFEIETSEDTASLLDAESYKKEIS